VKNIFSNGDFYSALRLWKELVGREILVSLLRSTKKLGSVCERPYTCVWDYVFVCDREREGGREGVKSWERWC